MKLTKKIVSAGLLLVMGLGVANLANAQTLVQIKKRSAQGFALDGGHGAANGKMSTFGDKGALM